MEDRFTQLSDNYGDLFSEVFQLQGYDYHKTQQQVFEIVKKLHSDLIHANILDMGIGDGETIQAFVDYGCKNLTGIDLNPKMVNTSKEKFGEKVTVLQMDVLNMKEFNSHFFDIIVTGMCIHNIPRNKRVDLWKEIVRLRPKYFILLEKVADTKEQVHKQMYQREIDAINRIYREKYKFEKVADEWVKHYYYDEQEKMYFKEIREGLKEVYDVNIVTEIGMYKLISAVLKKF